MKDGGHKTPLDDPWRLLRFGGVKIALVAANLISGPIAFRKLSDSQSSLPLPIVNDILFRGFWREIPPLHVKVQAYAGGFGFSCLRCGGLGGWGWSGGGVLGCVYGVPV